MRKIKTMIRKASPKDLDVVKGITEACAAHMIAQGIYQWNEHYPSRAVFQQDIANGQLYVYLHESQPVGCVMFSKEKDALYNSIHWQTPDGNNLYIHRLAVHPNFQGQGIARQLMDYAEAHAQQEKCTAVRLDTFSKNPRNHRFYKARGYQQLGDVIFPKQSEYPFHCFEKILTY